MEMILFSDYLKKNSLPSILDDATAELIKEWFKYRYLESKRGTDFLKRAIIMNYPYYKEMLRIDPTISDYDWLVQNYLERQTASNTKASENSSNTLNSTNGNEFSSDGSQTASAKNAETTRTMAQARTNPMSASYSGSNRPSPPSGIGGMSNVSISGFEEPDIINPTTSGDTYIMGTGGSESSNIDKSRTSSKTTGRQSGSSSTSTSTDDIVQEIVTGRNMEISPALEKAKGYIANSRSWLWLYGQLDKCFIQCYNIDENEI